MAIELQLLIWMLSSYMDGRSNSCFRRLNPPPQGETGLEHQRRKGKMIKESQRAADQFISKLPREKQERFKKLLEVGRKIYQFQEDHGFYIDGASTARLHDVGMTRKKVNSMNF
jgi:hypothetical protein